MKGGTSPSSSLFFFGTSTPSLSATGETSIEKEVWSGNAEICSEEVSIMREGVECRTCLHC